MEERTEKERSKLEKERLRELKTRERTQEMKRKMDESRFQSINRFRQNSDVIAGVQILVPANGCENCRKHHHEFYTLDNIPNLPIEECTNGHGYCRCTFASVIEGMPPRK